MNKNDEDRKLIEAYLNGNIHSFELFYDGCKNALYTFIYRRNKANADDLFQETFSRFLRIIQSKKIESPRSYLFKIAANLINSNSAYDDKHSSLELEKYSIENIEETDSILDELDSKKLKTTLEQLSEKKPNFYDVLHLHIYEKRTFKEVSKILNRSNNTVASQYRYALQFIKKLWSKK